MKRKLILSIKRAEAVTIINRMLGRRVNTKDIPKELYDLYSDATNKHWAFADIIEASVTHDYTRKENGYEAWREYEK